MGNQKLAQSAGCVLFERGSTIIIAKQPKTWLFTARFIFLLLAIIATAFGLFQIVSTLLKNSNTLLLGAIFTAIGMFSFFILLQLNKLKKRTNELPAEKLKCLCIIDLANKELLDCKRNSLSPLAEVEAKKLFQATSSSPALALVWPKGKIKIAKGTPFNGGIEPILQILNEQLNL